MGLSVNVGYLSALLRDDPEAGAVELEVLAAVNAALLEHGITPHIEPRDCQSWDADGYGYLGLHALREIAGMVWKSAPIPRDTILDGQVKNGFEQILFDACLTAFEAQPKSGWVSRILKRTQSPVPPFIHLVLHSDAAGYYLPVDFAIPVMISTEDRYPAIWPVGSSLRLHAELSVLARELQVPASLHSGDNLLIERLDRLEHRPDGPLWEAQPIAVHSLLILREACQHSLASGSAITFA